MENPGGPALFPLGRRRVDRPQGQLLSDQTIDVITDRKQ